MRKNNERQIKKNGDSINNGLTMINCCSYANVYPQDQLLATHTLITEIMKKKILKAKHLQTLFFLFFFQNSYLYIS